MLNINFCTNNYSYSPGPIKVNSSWRIYTPTELSLLFGRLEKLIFIAGNVLTTNCQDFKHYLLSFPMKKTFYFDEVWWEHPLYSEQLNSCIKVRVLPWPTDSCHLGSSGLKVNIGMDLCTLCALITEYLSLLRLITSTVASSSSESWEGSIAWVCVWSW